MNDKVFVVFAKKDLEKVCQECKDNKYCLKFENDLIRCNLINPTHFKNLRKHFEPAICYWANKNPCSNCRDKSECLQCPKACEYVQSIYEELVKNIKKEQKNDR